MPRAYGDVVVQSVELLLDAALENEVRREWTLLAEAGLPSQARHRGASNRPHATLAVADALTPEAEQGFLGLDLPADLDVRLGGWLLFGRRSFVLCRTVVPSTGLLALQHEVARLVGPGEHVRDNGRPDRWTPHVTLARHLTGAQVDAALGALAERPRDLAGTASGLRRWDGDERREWPVATGS
jgi:2'-5' RNA ligase